MTEDKHDDISLNSDDLNVLNVLLHTVKGLSAISTTGMEAVQGNDPEV
jgi:hypothetical protein